MLEEKKKLRQSVEQTCEFILSKGKVKPEVGIVLGTGLGRLAKRLKTTLSIPYEEVPNFPVSTVQSHAGNLLFGELNGKQVVMMEGRFHFYEGYSMQEITFPIRVMKALGIKVLILSNAAGGLNPEYAKGDIAVVTDHINFMGTSPLIGPNDAKLGPRFPDMIEPYSKRLIEITEKVAKQKNVTLRKGVYIAVTGPNLETRAEYRFMRQIGADVVGMSTVPEVIVGVHAGLEVLTLSIVTDICLPDSLQPVDIDEIIHVADTAAPKLDSLVDGVVEAI